MSTWVKGNKVYITSKAKCIALLSCQIQYTHNWTELLLLPFIRGKHEKIIFPRVVNDKFWSNKKNVILLSFILVKLLKYFLRISSSISPHESCVRLYDNSELVNTNDSSKRAWNYPNCAELLAWGGALSYRNIKLYATTVLHSVCYFHRYGLNFNLKSMLK